MQTDKMVFVFGSNEAGIHGAGAAKYAHDERGAIMGCCFGHTHRGDRIGSFAIPTKDHLIKNTIQRDVIWNYVKAFLIYAGGRPDLKFQVTAIGCGLAGLKHEDMAAMFWVHPSNCYFDLLWDEYLPAGTRFWGTF